jgi:hypothetical protein
VKDEVLERIRAAFFKVKRPRDDELQWHPDSSEELFIESFIGDTAWSWWEVSADKIAYECHALSAFSFNAYVYYLPAYMTWVLKNFETSDSNTSITPYTIWISVTRLTKDLYAGNRCPPTKVWQCSNFLSS